MVSAPFAIQEKILIPPLHIKLRLIKQFVKVTDKELEAFKHLVTAFPNFSEAKTKGGIFIGPQIRKLKKDPEFTGKFFLLEKQAWQSFVAVVNGFLGNKKGENYREPISDLLVA